MTWSSLWKKLVLFLISWSGAVFLGKSLGVAMQKPKKMQNTIAAQVKTSPEVQKVYNFLVPTFFSFCDWERSACITRCLIAAKKHIHKWQDTGSI